MAGITPPGAVSWTPSFERVYAFNGNFNVGAGAYATPSLALGDQGDNDGDLFEIGGASDELLIVTVDAIVAINANIVYPSGVGGEQVGAGIFNQANTAWAQQSAITHDAFETFLGVTMCWRAAAGTGFTVRAWSADTAKNGVYTDVFAQVLARG